MRLEDRAQPSQGGRELGGRRRRCHRPRASALLELAGVGVPTASTLLYFVFPADYPILDVRALESLGIKPRSAYPVAFWLEYLSTCRTLARRARVDIRTLDKALWQHSKERARL